MPGGIYKVAIGELTQRINKKKGKGSKEIYEALKPSSILKTDVKKKQGK